MANQVPLTRGMVAIVDPVDFRSMLKIKWHAFRNHSSGWYARGKVGGRHVFMHNLITGVKGVDHRDGNGLNNTRSNLRPATAQQNSRNKKKTSAPSTSRFKGVYLFRTGRWRAMISSEGVQVSIGFFPSEIEAALAYDREAKVKHGEFANLNFPEHPPAEQTVR